MTGKKSWFAENIIDLSGNKGEQPSAQPPASTITSYAVPTTTASSTPTAPVTGKISEDMKQFFAKIWEDNNIPAPDYKEFVEALNEMQGEDVPEKTKFKMLFATFKASKVTPARLIETADMYLNLFKEKKNAFDAEVRLKSSTVTTTKQKEADDLQAKEISLKEQIDKLTLELNEAKLKHAQVTKEISDAVGKYSQRLVDFEATYNSIVADINKNKELIKQYSA